MALDFIALSWTYSKTSDSDIFDFLFNYSTTNPISFTPFCRGSGVKSRRIEELVNVVVIRLGDGGILVGNKVRNSLWRSGFWIGQVATIVFSLIAYGIFRNLLLANLIWLAKTMPIWKNRHSRGLQNELKNICAHVSCAFCVDSHVGNMRVNLAVNDQALYRKQRA